MEPSDLKKFGEECGLKETDLETLSQSEMIQKKIIEKLDAKAKEAGFNSLEKVKGIYIEYRSLKELGLLTEAFKLKRIESKQYFKPKLDEIYKKLPK